MIQVFHDFDGGSMLPNYDYWNRSGALLGGLIVNKRICCQGNSNFPWGLCLRGDRAFLRSSISGLDSRPLLVLIVFYYLTFHYLNLNSLLLFNVFFGLATCIFC